MILLIILIGHSQAYVTYDLDTKETLLSAIDSKIASLSQQGKCLIEHVGNNYTSFKCYTGAANNQSLVTLFETASLFKSNYWTKSYNATPDNVESVHERGTFTTILMPQSIVMLQRTTYARDEITFPVQQRAKLKTQPYFPPTIIQPISSCMCHCLIRRFKGRQMPR
ncbi:hypothetical protein FGO68_gene10647 [Halteria grandinella]|uniref:Uncharacterized protein n=1 Tax=Halteria grandinella TaxID=5974 RepID=A0A8J8NX99_HALGN|nr:hypothetical protein FGO68_gene10647 [Halteria grandinella]